MPEGDESYDRGAMPDPLSPHDIARRTFDVARRGYEQQEVRGFLHEVSSLLERLQRTESELRERAERAEARLEMSERPDEATLLEVLGEETTRVLTSARESAAQIRAKAEEAAARLIEEATREASEIRSSATHDADARLAEASVESERLLEEARTELDRRQAEAREAADRIREAAAEEAESLRAAGRADQVAAQEAGEAEREASRQEGRRMVAEAQAVRERVLRDLAARRKKARVQVEKLNAGRERLLEAYDVVRRTVDEATTELTHALGDARLAADAAARRVDEEPEPTLEQLDAEVADAGLVDLPIADLEPHGAEPTDGPHPDEDTPGPFSGEVPAVTDAGEAAPPVEGADPGAAEAPRVIELDHGRGRKRRKKGFDGLPPAPLTVVEPPTEVEAVRILAEPAAAEGSDADAGAEGSADAPDAEATASETAEEPAEATPAPPTDEPVEGPAADEAEAPPAADDGDSAAAEGAEEDAADTGRAADVFARLRAEQETTEEPSVEPADAEVPSDDAGGVEPSTAPDGEAVESEEEAAAPAAEGDGEVHVDEAARPFLARASALEAVEKDLGRRLKRVLADEQNEVLDLLRRAKPKGADDVLPSLAEHTERWAAAATGPLADAVGAGADWSGGKASPSSDLADDLSRTLVTPLRERIERSFAAADGNLDEIADRVRALYREWKGPRLNEAIADAAAAGYARGVLDGIPAGAKVRWALDPSAGPCPDCDDNVLAGALTKGEPFPTGGANAPAHPGCHCLVLPAEA